MHINDNYIAHLVLKGDVTSTLEEKFQAVVWLQESGLFWKLSGEDQNDGKAIIAAYGSTREAA